MSSAVNKTPYLRTSREFPDNIEHLSKETLKAYIDTANAVNNRIVGIFPTKNPSLTGESWFITTSRQQSFREFYTSTTTTAIPHGIKFFSSIPYFTRMWGQYTDGTNWYGLIPGSNVAIAGQISFYIDPVNINFVVGAGSPPVTALTKFIIILEWMSNP